MYSLSEKEVDDCVRLFLQYDKDGNRELSIKEVSKMIEGIGWAKGSVNNKTVMSWFFKGGQGGYTVSVLDFLRVYAERDPEMRKEARLRRYFRDLDTDNSGTLTTNELVVGLRNAGFDFTGTNTADVFQPFFGKKDGVGIEEFIKHFKSFKQF